MNIINIIVNIFRSTHLYSHLSYKCPTSKMLIWGRNIPMAYPDVFVVIQWASCQIGILVGAHAPGIPGTFSPPAWVSDPDMHHGTYVAHVSWCLPGSLTSGFLWSWRRGKTFPAFPPHAQPTILRIWLEAHGVIALYITKSTDSCDTLLYISKGKTSKVPTYHSILFGKYKEWQFDNSMSYVDHLRAITASNGSISCTKNRLCYTFGLIALNCNQNIPTAFRNELLQWTKYWCSKILYVCKRILQKMLFCT